VRFLAHAAVGLLHVGVGGRNHDGNIGILTDLRLASVSIAVEPADVCRPDSLLTQRRKHLHRAYRTPTKQDVTSHSIVQKDCTTCITIRRRMLKLNLRTCIILCAICTVIEPWQVKGVLNIRSSRLIPWRDVAALRTQN
jgi:hypothetical protein